MDAPEEIQFRSRKYWQSVADQFNADVDRVIVWDAFSDMFLDTWFDDDYLEGLARTIADSPFTTEELAHILSFEVTPVCFVNLLCVAGEWAGFAHEWLVPKCKKQQRRHRFRSSGHPDEVPFYFEILSCWLTSDAYKLFCRVQKIRQLVERAQA